MVSDRALYVCTAIVSALLLVLGLAVTGSLLIIATELEEQTNYISNLVIPVAADLDGDGKMNDLVYSYAGSLGLKIANQTRTDERGYWSNNASRNAFMGNTIIRKGVNMSS